MTFDVVKRDVVKRAERGAPPRPGGRDAARGDPPAGGEPFARAAARLRGVLARAEMFPGIAASRGSIEAGIEAVERARSNLHGSLWILLLGGTGVGKSTLLNALAGRLVAPASVRRPTTTRTTFYAHREASLAPLGDVPAGAGELTHELETHEVEALRDKVVIDPPDFDSTVEANRRRLVPLLEAADLVITVVDREKYRDHALYELLARFRGEKSFLFVGNKADLGWADEVDRHFRASLAEAGFPDARLLTVSALAAFEARRSGEAGPGERSGDFAELERIIAEEFDRARVREIKRTNLAGIAAHVFERVDRALGPDARGRVERSRRRCRGIAEGVTGRVRELFTRAVLAARGRARTDALRAYLRGLQLFSFGGVFGVYLALAERLRSFVGKAWPRPIDAIEARSLAESRVRSVDEREVALVLANARAEATAEFASAGLSSEVARARLDPARSSFTASGAAAEAAEGAGEALESLTESALGAGRFNFRNLFYNLIPTLLLLSIPAYAVYATAWPNAGPFLGTVSDAAVMGFIAILMFCFLESALVDRAFLRGSARGLTEIRSRMAARLDAYIQSGLTGPCEDLAREATRVLDEVEAARREVGPGGR